MYNVGQEMLPALHDWPGPVWGCEEFTGNWIRVTSVPLIIEAARSGVRNNEQNIELLMNNILNEGS